MSISKNNSGIFLTYKLIVFSRFRQNRKINIEVMKVMDIMVDITTTLSVSKSFHDWLKSKGGKGENYEEIIKKLLKPEFVKELGSREGFSTMPSKEAYPKIDKLPNDIKQNTIKIDAYTNSKPVTPPIIKKPQVAKSTGNFENSY